MSYREHEPYHERRLEQQTLDVLLRIEEKLADQRELTAELIAALRPPVEEPPPLPKGKRK
jgi:hypothetical protein